MPLGGARAGSGRKKGVTNNPFRKALIAWMNDPKRRQKYLEALEYWIKEKDKSVLMWLGDQAAGKATQALEIDGDFDVNHYDSSTFTDAQLRKALERKALERRGTPPATDGAGDGRGAHGGTSPA